MRLIAIAGLALLALAASAQVPLPQGVTQVTTVEGITEYNLANGLRVLFAPDPSKPTTTVSTTYLVGSRHESYGETGMAHLLEHLMGFGTPTFPDQKAQRIRRGLRVNANTWYDRTNYFAQFATSEENLDWYLRWSADAMTNSFIAKKDLDTEMTVVRNEMERGENNPQRILFQRTMGAAYSWHNYGKSTIGARSDVENVNIERLQAFYRHYYQPDNAVLVVTGKFDEAKTLALIAREYSKIPRPARKLQPTYTIDAEQHGERSVTVRRAGDTPLALALYHVPAAAHSDFAAVELFTSLMSETPAGRLHRGLVESKLAARVYGSSFALREPGVASFGAEVASGGSLDTVKATLIAAIEGVASSPITDAEVDRARTRLLNDFALQAADPERVGLALSNAIAAGDWRLFFLRRDRIRDAKTADVQRVATTYFLPDNRTLGLYIPTPEPRRAPTPVMVDVAPLVKDYKGEAAVAAGEAFDATPANIEARTQRLRVADGMRMALLPKKTRGGVVHAQLTLRFGDEKSLFGTNGSGSATAAMLNRGAAGMNRAQIREAFEKLQARVFFAGTPSRMTASIETTRANLPEVMKLVAKVVRTPDFPAAELEQLRTERVTAIEAQRTQPEDIARDALGRQGNPYPRGHVLHDRTFAEELADTKALTVEHLRAFHRDFYGADHADFVAVGDFDDAGIKSQLAELFGGWKSAKPYARVSTPLYAVAPADLRIETPDRANAFFLARSRFGLRDDAPDYAAALVANRIVGNVSSSILFNRIRTREGISYGVGSGLAVGSHEPHSTWTAYAIYAPQNVKRLEAAFREELARVQTAGFTAKEVEDGKRGMLLARRLALAQDRDLVATLSAQLELGRTMDHVSGVDRAIESLTLEQVNAAARAYIDPSKLVLVYAGDFAKGKQ